MPLSLRLDEEKINTLCEKYGTPLQLYDEVLLTDRVNHLNKCFKKYFPEFVNYFAVKALPNPAILKVLANLGNGFDCSSVNEVEAVSRIGISGDRVMYTSNFTSAEDLKFAVDRNVIINLDDISLLENMSNMPELISFRLNPGVGRTDSSTVSNVLGGPSAKFGVAKDQIIESYRRAVKKGVTKFGIHMMTGSCVTNKEYWEQTVSILLNTIKDVHEELGIQFEFINIGGGLGIPYRLNEEVAAIADVAKTVSDVFSKFFKVNGDVIERPKLRMENGRYVTGPIGWLLSKCQAVKRNSYGIYYGLDSCMANLMRPGMYNSYHHITVLGKSSLDNEVNDEEANVVGTLCENNDWFAKQRKLPKSEIGDIFVIYDTGAHAHSMGFNYNSKLRAPEILIRTDDSSVLIRHGETYDTLFGNTVMPNDFQKEVFAAKALYCLDLTSLNEADSEASISSLCEKSNSIKGNVAALCVYPKFVVQVKEYLSKIESNIKIATVVNFPSGDASVSDVVKDILKCIKDGADEIDAVICYKKVVEFFKGGDYQDAKKTLEFFDYMKDFVRQLKDACGSKKLKIIIESGYLEDKLHGKLAESAIKFCCEAIIVGGGDVIKTSTGKVKTNATLSASRTILNCINLSWREVGFKAAGGIRSMETAIEYITLVQEVCGEGFLAKGLFRIGASSLLNDINLILQR